MNGLDWRNLWDLAVIEQEQRNHRLERERIRREAGIVPAGPTARLTHSLGTWLVSAGQRLAAEPHRPYAASAS